MKKIHLRFTALAICALLAQAAPSFGQAGDRDRDSNSKTYRDKDGDGDRDEDHGKWGLVGLLGLIGLAGLAKKRETTRYTTTGTGTSSPGTRRND